MKTFRTVSQRFTVGAGGSVGPSAAAAAAESGAAWSTETEALTSNDTYAGYTGTGQEFLYVTDFGVTYDTPTAHLIGLEVTIEGNGGSATPTERAIEVTITLDGTTQVAASDANTLTLNETTDTTQTIGGPLDAWSLDQVSGDFTASTFGVRIRKNTAGSAAINIDYVTVTLYFGDEMIFTPITDTTLGFGNMTVYASSGGRVINGTVSFQPRLNTKVLGSEVVVSDAELADVVYSSGGGAAASNNNLFPGVIAGVDPLTFNLRIHNDAGTPVPLTIHAVYEASQ